MQNAQLVVGRETALHKLWIFKKIFNGTSLVVQWLRLHASNAEGMGSIPGWGTLSHMPQGQKVNNKTFFKKKIKKKDI